MPNNVLFFDADKELKKFARNCRIEGYNYIFFDEPFYFISPKKLNKSKVILQISSS